jgi:hypothetical protein
MYFPIRFVLVLGVILGFGSEWAHHVHRHHEAFERHVAEVCAHAVQGTAPAAPEKEP